MALDLSTFTPGSVGELLDGIVTQVSGVLGEEWKTAQGELKGYLENIANAAFNTTQQLAQKKITQDQANLAFHLQEIGLNQVLLYSKVLTYVAAQKVLNGTFAVIMAAVKNITGVDLSWLVQ